MNFFKFGRWLIKVVFIFLILLIEKVMGVPVLTLLFSVAVASRLSLIWKWAFLIIITFLLGTIFMVNLAEVWGIVSCSYLFYKYGQKFISSHLVRLSGVSFLGAFLLVILGFGQVNAGQLWYALSSITLGMLWLKRDRFKLIL